MRLPIVVLLPLAPLAPIMGCAHAERPVPAPMRQTSLGMPDAFGSGIVAVTTRTVTVALTAPAHVAVVRVFPGDSAVLAYPAERAAARAVQEPLQPGARRLELTIKRTRDPMPDLLARRRQDSGDENACRMRRAMYEATRPRDTLNPRPPRPFWEPCYSPPQHLDQQPAERWVLGAPISPGAHYLVVIATDANLDPMTVTERLSELDISLASGDAAARIVPEYLVGEGARWAAWVVYRP